MYLLVESFGKDHFDYEKEGFSERVACFRGDNFGTVCDPKLLIR